MNQADRQQLRRDLDKQRRWGKSAQTWLAKAVAIMRHNYGVVQADEPLMMNLRDMGLGVYSYTGWDAAMLLQTVLDAAEDLADLIDDEAVEDARKRAVGVATALRRRALAEKLTNTEGRTDEEAAAFRDKARELGERA